MDEKFLEEFHLKSRIANEKIENLRSKIEALKKANNEGEDKETIDQLLNENQYLKQQVEALKNKLIELDLSKSSNSVAHQNGTNNSRIESTEQTQKTESHNQIPQSSSDASKPAQDTKHKNKEAKKPKQQAEAETQIVKQEPIDVSKLDIRIGKIIECGKHPQADLLYVEKIDLGEAKPRNVCSGLVKFIPIEEMQNRMVVLLCNLKPAKLKGVESEAMVLCASTPDKVELLIPPENAQIGDRVICKGFEGTPVAEINNKNKIFDVVQPDLKVDDNLVATYKGVALEIESKGVIRSPSLKNVPIK